MAKKEEKVTVVASAIPAETTKIVKRWLNAGFEFGQIAAAAQRSRSTIWRWMNGSRTPRPDSWLDFVNRVGSIDIQTMQRKVRRNG